MLLEQKTIELYIMSVELYAPTVYKALNGVFCVYKLPGDSVFKLADSLRMNLARGNSVCSCPCVSVIRLGKIALKF